MIHSEKTPIVKRSLFSYLYEYVVANRKAIVLFLFVGTLAATINFASFTVFWKWMGMNYKVAVSMAYVLSVVVHFMVNRKVTFQGDHTHFLLQMPRYLTMILINYVMTLVVTRMVVELFHMSPYLGLFCSIGVTTNISYFLLRYWVFPRAA